MNIVQNRLKYGALFFLSLLLIISAGMLTGCGNRVERLNGVPSETAVVFAPDSLQWGMSQQEVLKALDLKETAVKLEEEVIPAEGLQGNQPSRTLQTIICDDMYFHDIPIRASFVFVTKNSEPAWDIGLSRIYIDLLADSVETSGKLKDAVAKSSLGISIKWEDLTERQKEIMWEYYRAVYPEFSGETSVKTAMEMLGINSVAGSSVKDGTDGVYGTVSWDGEYPAVWNRFVLSDENRPEP